MAIAQPLESHAPARVSEAEQRTRVELAALYRLADHYGWTDLIYNHFAARVPGESSFLVKAHAELFSKVRASSLVKVRLDGKDMDAKGFVRGEQRINRAGFTIHSAVLNARADVNFTLHVHTRAGAAVSAIRDGLLMVSQEAMQFHERMSYHDFEGVATDLSEADRLARDLGAANMAMILRNHGLLTCGVTAASALTRMRYLMEACEIQLMLQATGREIVVPSKATCEHTARQMAEYQTLSDAHEMAAYLEMADDLGPGFRD